jgi:hypothetical protein
MTYQFTRHGKIYQSTVSTPLHAPPPPSIVVFFRQTPKPPCLLKLGWLKTDDRGIEIYGPLEKRL